MESLERSCRDQLIENGFDVSNVGIGVRGGGLHAYGRVLHRSIAPRPRSVRLSRELVSQLRGERNEELVARVRAVEEEMCEGQDLNVRLSRKYYDASYNDPLLNDLGVHHFHLGD